MLTVKGILRTSLRKCGLGFKRNTLDNLSSIYYRIHCDYVIASGVH
jgi:hypothetical protein